MTLILDEILSHPLVTVTDRHDEMGSFSISLGNLKTNIIIELGRFRTSQTTKFDVSHSIHTPKQAGPYRTSKPWDDSWEGALHRAISGLTMEYEIAVNHGHEPNESWLVKN